MSQEESTEQMHDDHSSKFSTERPCMFYKLIVDSIIQDKKLMIPKKFVKRYGHRLSTVAFLAVPGSSNWPVEIQRAGKKFWFHRGWYEFLEYHSIHPGYFLIFLYEENSKFSVTIYDLACSEIKSSCGLSTSSKESSLVKQYSEECEENVKVDMFNFQYQPPTLQSLSRKFVEGSSSLKKYERPTQHVDASNFQKKLQYTQSTGTQTDMIELEECKDRNGLHSAYEAKRTYKGKQRTKADVHVSSLFNEERGPKMCRRSISSKYVRRLRDVTTAERESAIHASKMCIPVNPYFRVTLRPCNVLRKLVHVPRCFVKKHLHGVPLLLTLQLSDGKRWPVKCIEGGNGSGKLSKGWSKFSRENNLEEGDSCVFELIETKQIVLKVIIFRVLEDAGRMNKL